MMAAANARTGAPHFLRDRAFGGSNGRGEPRLGYRRIPGALSNLGQEPARSMIAEMLKLRGTHLRRADFARTESHWRPDYRHNRSSGVYSGRVPSRLDRVEGRAAANTTCKRSSTMAPSDSVVGASQRAGEQDPALSARSMPDDWQTRYGHRPPQLETLFDANRFRGTCYRAANRIYIGQTAGGGRTGRERNPRSSHQRHLHSIRWSAMTGNTYA